MVDPARNVPETTNSLVLAAITLAMVCQREIKTDSSDVTFSLNCQ